MVTVTCVCLDTSVHLRGGTCSEALGTSVQRRRECVLPSMRAVIAVAIETKSAVFTVPFGDVSERSLSRHQDTFLMETLEHVQWTVGQHHLLRADLPREAEVT